MKLTPEISFKLIEILGEERINAVYDLMKSKHVSFSMLRYMIRREKIAKEIGEGSSIQDVMRKYHLSKMTIYRLLNKSRKESNT